MSSSIGINDDDKSEEEQRLRAKILADMKHRILKKASGSASPTSPIKASPTATSEANAPTQPTVSTINLPAAAASAMVSGTSVAAVAADSLMTSNGIGNGNHANGATNGDHTNGDASDAPAKKKRSRWSSAAPPAATETTTPTAAGGAEGKTKKKSRWGADDPPRVVVTAQDKAIEALQQAAARPVVPGLPQLPQSLLPLLMAATTGNKEMLSVMVASLPTAPPPAATMTNTNGLSAIAPPMSNTQTRTMLLMPPSEPPSSSSSSAIIVPAPPSSDTATSSSTDSSTAATTAADGSTAAAPRRRNRWADATATTPTPAVIVPEPAGLPAWSIPTNNTGSSTDPSSTAVVSTTSSSTALVAIGKSMDYSHISPSEPGAVALMALAISDNDQGGKVETQLTLPGGGAKNMRPHSKRDALVERGMVIGMTGSTPDNQPPAVVQPFLPTAENIAELITLRNRLEICLHKLNNLAMGVLGEEGSRSPSPEPTYDEQGRRTNTREVRTRSKLNKEKTELMARLGALDPSYRPPPPEIPLELRNKKWKKIFLKNARDGENNWIGLIIGPRGNTQKRLEKECGCRIAVRGRGSHKDGRTKRRPDGSIFGGDDEELHILVTAGSDEDLERGVRAVEVILSDPADGAPDHKSASLRELAMMNGTWRDDPVCRLCGAKGHYLAECPDRQSSWQRARVKCDICGSEAHPTRDCSKPSSVIESRAAADADYDKFMNELSGDGPLSASVMAVTQPKLLTADPTATAATGDSTTNGNSQTPNGTASNGDTASTAAQPPVIPNIIPSLPAMRGPYMGPMNPMIPSPMMPMMAPMAPMMPMMPGMMPMMPMMSPYGYYPPVGMPYGYGAYPQPQQPQQ